MSSRSGSPAKNQTLRIRASKIHADKKPEKQNLLKPSRCQWPDPLLARQQMNQNQPSNSGPDWEREQQWGLCLKDRPCCFG
jgi:hypothetical protein